MPDRFSRLRGIVWSAVVAAVSGILSVTAATCGASAELVGSLAGLGLILALLSSRQ